MFGPFSAGDSLRVYRLQRKGVSLDLQRELTQPSTPLWEAWLAFLTQQAMGQPTYVLDDLHNGEGFVQVRYRPHQAAVDVAFLAPTLNASSQAANIWRSLLDGACVEAAGRGIQRVFATLPETGAELDIFQQSGFSLYAGETIFRLPQPAATGSGEEIPAVRPQRPDDWPAIQKLCVAITPQRVRQAEGGLAITAGRERNCQRFVWAGESGDDLLAALSLCIGAQAHWLRVLVHPDARTVADGFVRWAVSTLAEQPPKPVYCNVRQYEGGVRVALDAVGFRPFSDRALMVRHTVAWSKASAPELSAALKGSAEPVPPAFHINGEPELKVPQGRLATTGTPDA